MLKLNIQLFAVPFRRTSKTKKRMRRTHLKLTPATLTACPKCGATIKPHRACTKCGFYKGQDVLNKTKEETKAPEKATLKVKEKAKKETKKPKTEK